MKKATFLAFLLSAFTASAQVSVTVSPLDLELVSRVTDAGQPLKPSSDKVSSGSAAFSPSVQVLFPISSKWAFSAGLGHSRRYTNTGFNSEIAVVKQAVNSSAPIPERGVLTDVTTRDYYLSVPLGLYYRPVFSRKARAIIGLQIRSDIRTAGRQTADFLPERFSSAELNLPELKRDVEAYFAERATPVLFSLAPTLGFDAPLTPRLALVMTGRAIWFANGPDRVTGGFGWGLGGQAGLRYQFTR
ncbi:porin family protein [Tellurirhabdus rosea]|uniref:hypothetical protein n=1 Tax=Tellurirhabdus rosea TaxID=2674997 RepID=UPI00225886BD|nr:hypothetical protein [Tellurirhabdus rosea]